MEGVFRHTNSYIHSGPTKHLVEIYTSIPLCHSDFSSCEKRFPWPLKMIPNLGCSPYGRNITCREHWRFSNPEPGSEIHVLCVEPSFTLWYVLIDFRTVHNKGKCALIDIEPLCRLIVLPFLIITRVFRSSLNALFSKHCVPFLQ